MKNALTYMKFAVAIFFMSFVAFNFYKINPYYENAALFWKLAAFHIFLALSMSTAIYFIGQKKQSITIKWLFGLILLCTFIVGTYQFAVSDFSRLVDGTLVREGTKIEIVQPEDVTESMTVLFEKDQLVRETKYIAENLPESIRPAFQKAKFIESMVSYSKYILATFSGALIFFLIFAGLGTAIFFRKAKQITLEQHLISFFPGAAVFSVAIFALNLAGAYTIKSFLIVLALAILISFKQIWGKIKFLWSERISIENNKKETIVILGFFIVMLAMCLLDSIRPFPIAWDDINLYGRAAKLMVTDNLFPQGIGPTAWTNLQSISWLFVDTFQGTYAILFTSFTLMLALFYILARKFISQSSSLWATLFLSLIPMISFFYAIDTKIEIPLLATSIAAMLALETWLHSDKKHDLILTAVLFGFLVTIKITALLFVWVLLLLAFYLKTQKKYLTASLYFAFMSAFAFGGQMATLQAFKLNPTPFAIAFLILAILCAIFSIKKEKPLGAIKQLKPFLIFGGIILLFMLPWMIWHYVETGHFTISSLVFGEKDIIKFEYERVQSCQENFAFFADYKRYAGPGQGLLSLIYFPWNTTMTPELGTFISDITFLFLGIAPFWLLFPKKIFQESNKNLLLLVFTAAYALLWMLVSSGVSWYGIFILIPAVILLFFTIEKKEIWWRTILMVFIVISLIGNFLLRNQFYAEARMFAYSVGLYNNDTILIDFYPGFYEIVQILDEYKKTNKAPIIYKVGTQSKYFLPVPDSNIIDDDFMDYYSCAIKQKSIEEIRQLFAEKGITHIFMHRGVELSTDSEFYDEYIQKRDAFEEFLQNSGWPIVYSGHDLVLLEVQ
ncbi:glycosyltransferase family 39 protein [Patescibacteria group bacterium]|nr:glycosyltransferase family 39 protein [Patescibacteria group bacterium]